MISVYRLIMYLNLIHRLYITYKFIIESLLWLCTLEPNSNAMWCLSKIDLFLNKKFLKLNFLYKPNNVTLKW